MADNKPLAEIADLLQEDRTFEPSPAFRAAANVRDAAVYARAEADPEAVLGELRHRARVVHAVDARARMESSACEVVRRRDAERQRQLRRSPYPRAAAKQGGDRLGR